VVACDNIDRALLFEDNLDIAATAAWAALKRLPLSFDLDDLLQAARIGLWMAAERWDGRGDFRGFARNRTRLAVIDHLRSVAPISRDRWKRVKAGDEAWLPVPIEDALKLAAEGDFDDPILKSALARALTGLSDRERHYVLRTFWHGLTVRVVAEGEGIREAAGAIVRSRALRKLKQALEAIGWT
jgi:RNA polymerase sigma factor (sigma-70 family)